MILLPHSPIATVPEVRMCLYKFICISEGSDSINMSYALSSTMLSTSC